MNKITSIIFAVVLLAGISFIFIGEPKQKNDANTSVNEVVQNSEIKDGIQYITINAKGGYSPKVSVAKVGIPTKLIIKTEGTYDCSASLVVRSLGFQKTLTQTGEEVIDVGVPKVGQKLQGVCGMGMYSFLVKFS